jgi:hypothetical protein
MSVEDMQAFFQVQPSYHKQNVTLYFRLCLTAPAPKCRFTLSSAAEIMLHPATVSQHPWPLPCQGFWLVMVVVMTDGWSTTCLAITPSVAKPCRQPSLTACERRDGGSGRVSKGSLGVGCPTIPAKGRG